MVRRDGATSHRTGEASVRVCGRKKDRDKYRRGGEKGNKHGNKEKVNEDASEAKQQWVNIPILFHVEYSDTSLKKKKIWFYSVLFLSRSPYHLGYHLSLPLRTTVAEGMVGRSSQPSQETSSTPSYGQVSLRDWPTRTLKLLDKKRVLGSVMDGVRWWRSAGGGWRTEQWHGDTHERRCKTDKHIHRNREIRRYLDAG